MAYKLTGWQKERSNQIKSVAKSIRENQLEDKNFINVLPFTSFYGEWTTQKKTQTFFYTPNNYSSSRKPFVFLLSRQNLHRLPRCSKFQNTGNWGWKSWASHSRFAPIPNHAIVTCSNIWVAIQKPKYLPGVINIVQTGICPDDRYGNVSSLMRRHKTFLSVYIAVTVFIVDF